MYLKQKYEVFSLVVGATAVNSLDWEQNQTHYFHIENCCMTTRLKHLRTKTVIMALNTLMEAP